MTRFAVCVVDRADGVFGTAVGPFGSTDAAGRYYDQLVSSERGGMIQAVILPLTPTSAEPDAVVDYVLDPA